MKKWLLLFPLLGILAFPWSCGNSPSNPATPTPTFTPTPTNWGGFTSTYTGTPTSTATSTATNLNGITNTPTLSPSITNTPTITNSPTVTNSPTPVNTPTYTWTTQPTSTPVVNATPIPTVTAQWMPSGLQYPNGVAYGNNLIYVAEGNGENSQAQVLVLNANGGVSTAITQYGTDNFTQPYGVALNQAGTTLFVLDGGSPGVLYAFTSGWLAAGAVTVLGSGSVTSGPEGIAVDSSGTTVFVSDYLNNMIDEYSYSGSSFAFVQSLTNNFNGPSGLVTDSFSNLYVADSGNAGIQKFDGSNWSGFASTAINGSSDVFGLGIDGTGNIYACDAGNSVIQEFSSNGALLSIWGAGTGGQAFSSPDGIAFTGTQIIVSDYSNGAGIPYGTGSLLVFNP